MVQDKGKVTSLSFHNVSYIYKMGPIDQYGNCKIDRAWKFFH